MSDSDAVSDSFSADNGALMVRRADDGDVAGIVALAAQALKWVPGEPHEELFRWKHLENPAGRSPMWVAEHDGNLVGVRVMLRWLLEDDEGIVCAVRAVDTATHPAHQGQGIFRRLTMTAVRELTDEGVQLVFNTPNEQSRPGYLRMGWLEVGRVRIAVRPRGVGALARMAQARTPADKWSQPLHAGERVLDVPASTLRGLLLRSGPPRAGTIRTHRSVEHLRWRYGFDPLHYRAVLLTSDPEDGLAIVRVRKRGGAREAAVCELFAVEHAARRSLLRAVMAATRADYLVASRGTVADGLVPLVGQGPVLTWRALQRQSIPALHGWDLQLGDVELL